MQMLGTLPKIIHVKLCRQSRQGKKLLYILKKKVGSYAKGDKKNL